MATVLWVTVIGWLVTPILSFILNKFLSYLDFDLSRKLHKLKINIIPSLEHILGDVTEQRMLRGAKDEGKGSESDLKKLGELEKVLKFELYDIGDVMDLIEYRRIERKSSGGISIRSWVLQVVAVCITCCKRSSFWQMLCQCAQNQYQKLSGLGSKVQQWAIDIDLKFWDLLAKLQQYAQHLNQMFRDLRVRVRANLVQQGPQSLPEYINQEAAGQPSMLDAPAARSTADDIEQELGTMQSPTPGDAISNPLTPIAHWNSTGPATELRDDNQHRSAEAPTLDATSNSLVQMSWDWLVYGYLSARDLRDWLYGPLGNKVLMSDAPHDHFQLL